MMNLPLEEGKEHLATKPKEFEWKTSVGCFPSCYQHNVVQIEVYLSHPLKDPEKYPIIKLYKCEEIHVSPVV